MRAEAGALDAGGTAVGVQESAGRRGELLGKFWEDWEGLGADDFAPLSCLSLSLSRPSDSPVASTMGRGA